MSPTSSSPASRAIVLRKPPGDPARGGRRCRRRPVRFEAGPEWWGNGRSGGDELRPPGVRNRSLASRTGHCCHRRCRSPFQSHSRTTWNRVAIVCVPVACHRAVRAGTSTSGLDTPRAPGAGSGPRLSRLDEVGRGGSPIERRPPLAVQGQDADHPSPSGVSTLRGFDRDVLNPMVRPSRTRQRRAVSWTVSGAPFACCDIVGRAGRASGRWDGGLSDGSTSAVINRRLPYRQPPAVAEPGSKGPNQGRAPGRGVGPTR